MLLIEEFKFRYLVVLVGVLLKVTVFSLVLGIHFRYVAGLQGLGLYLRHFWISCWVSGGFDVDHHSLAQNIDDYEAQIIVLSALGVCLAFLQGALR